MTSPLPDKEVDAFADALNSTLESIHESGRFKDAKSKFLDEIWNDIEVGVIQRMGEDLRGHVHQMAARAVTEILEGREDQMKRYLNLDGYTGRDHSHSVIHGMLFETNFIELRRKMAQAHADLIQNERIKDLEALLDSMVNEVKKKDAEIARLRNVNSFY